MRTPSLLLSAVFVLSLSACGGGAGGGGGNGPGQIGADVVAFTADGRSLGVAELFVSDADGANVRVVSGPLLASADLQDFAWSPDHTRLAFTMNREDPARNDLYVVDPLVGTPVRMSTNVGPGGGVSQFAWSPDGLRLAWRAKASLLGETALWTSLVASPAPAKASITPPQGGGVKSFAWQPGAGNDRLAYVGDMQTFLRFELYVVRFDGTLHQQVHPEAQISGGQVESFAWAPDGTYVAFLADLATDGEVELWSAVASSNGAANKLSALPANTASRHVSSFRWSPDSVFVSYVADEDVGGRFELFVSNFNGALHAKYVTCGAGEDVLDDVAWSPTASRLAYRKTNAVSGAAELFTIDALGGNLTPVWTGIGNGADGVTKLGWSPDGVRIAWIDQFGANGPYDVRSAIPGVSSVTLSPPLAQPNTKADVVDFLWSPDSTHLAYTREFDPGAPELVICKGSGSGPITLSNVPAGSLGVEQFLFTDDSSQVVYRGADGNAAAAPVQIYVVFAAGSPIRAELLDGFQATASAFHAEVR